MNIKTFGYRGEGTKAIHLLEKSFSDFGHTVIENGEPDLIFDLNGFFDDALEYASRYPSAKTIFNLLNVDVLNPHWPTEKAKTQLRQCNIPTTVNQSAKKDIFERTGVDCQLIYYPMRPIKKENFSKTIDFIYVGRLFSKEKRFTLIPQVLSLLKYSLDSLIIIGPENPGCGYYTGVLPDDELNLVYNSAKYVFCPCWREGSLSMLEAVVAGAIPIVCDDNHWVHEFGLSEFAADSNPEAIAKKIMAFEKNKDYYLSLLAAITPGILEKFHSDNVAKRIVQLYNSI